MAKAPWDETFVLPPGDDPSLREAIFGDGRGLVAFYVDDNRELVRIFNLVWVS